MSVLILILNIDIDILGTETDMDERTKVWMMKLNTLFVHGMVWYGMV